MSPECNKCRLPMIEGHGLVRLWRCVACGREIPDERRR